MVERYQKITVGGLLVVKGKALVVRRSAKEPYLTGHYELPGGKVEFGHTPEESLEREFLEEVNLKVTVIRPYRTFSYISDEGRRHTVEVVYLVQLMDKIENIKLSEEHDDFKFVGLEDLNNTKMSDEIKTNIREGLKLI